MTAIGVNCLCFVSGGGGVGGESVTVFGFIRFLSPSFVCVIHNKSGNLAFRTTCVDDTHITLAVIPSQVEVSNSLSFFAITNIQKKICRVSIPVETIIPCLD